MPTIKNYKRTDRIDDFLDACIEFENGGEIDGKEFDSIKETGAIERLWSKEIAELVEMNQIGAGALKWAPLTPEEKTGLFNQVDNYLAGVKNSLKASRPG